MYISGLKNKVVLLRFTSQSPALFFSLPEMFNIASLLHISGILFFNFLLMKNLKKALSTIAYKEAGTIRAKVVVEALSY